MRREGKFLSFFGSLEMMTSPRGPENPESCLFCPFQCFPENSLSPDLGLLVEIFTTDSHRKYADEFLTD